MKNKTDYEKQTIFVCFIGLWRRDVGQINNGLLKYKSAIAEIKYIVV